jgi:putative transposase
MSVGGMSLGACRWSLYGTRGSTARQEIGNKSHQSEEVCLFRVGYRQTFNLLSYYLVVRYFSAQHCLGLLELHQYGVSIGEVGMARKSHSDEDGLRLLREIEVHLAGGSDVETACHAAGISVATYYTRRKKFGDMGRPLLAELKTLQRDNQRLKKIVADLELDKLILKENLHFFKSSGAELR